MMRIAVTSQNRKEVTEHAGRCRKFWVFETDGEELIGRELLELAREESFHDSAGDAPHPLDDVDVLIAGSMGAGLRRRMARKGIRAVVTAEKDPERAARLWLSGTLRLVGPSADDYAEGHDDGRDQHHGKGCSDCGDH